MSLKIIQGHSKLHRPVSGMCKLLLVLHCNYVSILHRFGDIQRKTSFVTFILSVIAPKGMKEIKWSENGGFAHAPMLSTCIFQRVIEVCLWEWWAVPYKTGKSLRRRRPQLSGTRAVMSASLGSTTTDVAAGVPSTRHRQSGFRSTSASPPRFHLIFSVLRTRLTL